ncbi:MAG TPA: antitoxin [Advenella kashmirensis]|uniref:Antitoxin n=1 Tax=Advenella kashmirensis TaxID=310575 RepID=A0A356LFM7_9BURK|nr:antitoxin [Advenella kashmirensis]
MVGTKTPAPHVSKFSTQEADNHDRWFRAEIQAAINDPHPSIPHDQIRTKMHTRIAELKLDTKR